MLGHPFKPELLAYAEGLVDGRGISTATARHISTCPVCAREVAAIRASIEFASSAKDLDPAEDSISRILIAARTERNATRRAKGGTPMLIFKGLAYAAGIAVVCTVVFKASLSTPATVGIARNSSATHTVAANATTAEELKRATSQIETLTVAVGSRADAPGGYRVLHQAREVLALDAELAAARAALQRNPTSERAAQVMTSNIRRQANALKSFYMERNL